MTLRARFLVETPLLIYSDPDVSRRRRALTTARRRRHDPGPVLEWFGTGATVPVSPPLVSQLREGLLNRGPSEPPITLYLDQIA